MSNDLAALVPATVTCAFPAQANGNLTTAETLVSVTLASLQLPEYGATVGAPWAEVLHRYELAQWVGPPSSGAAGGVLLNSAALTALATQIATDWYHWQLERRDEQLIGAVPWNPDGLEDLEWRHGHNRILTRLLRGPWNPQEDLLYTAPALIDQSVSVGNVYIDNSLVVYNGNTYQTYLSFTINYETNVAIFNVYNTVTNFYSVVNFYETVVFESVVNFYAITNFYSTEINIYGPVTIYDGVIWGSPVEALLLTGVCYYPFTKQTTIGSSTAIVNLTPTTLISVTFTLSEPTTAVVIGNIEWTGTSGAVNDAYESSLNVDGTIQTLHGYWVLISTSQREIGSQTWVVSLAAGSHTINLTAQKVSGTGGAHANVNTNLVIHTDGVLIAQYQYVALPSGTIFGAEYCTTNPQSCCTAQSGASGSSGSYSGSTFCGQCSTADPIATGWVVDFGLTGCGGGVPGSCLSCLGPTPTSWSFTGSGFSGVFAAYNAAFTLANLTTAGPQCNWFAKLSAPEALALTLFYEPPGPGTATLKITASSGDTAVYFWKDFLGDCCGAITLYLGSSTAPGAPATLTLNPSCTDSGGGPGTVEGPVTLTETGACCWAGTTTTGGTTALVTLCLVANGDGSTSWVLTAQVDETVVAVWRQDNGTAPVNCCYDLSLTLITTNCATATAANAMPLGCGQSGSGQSGASGVLTDCCPEPVPSTLYLSVLAGGTMTPLGTGVLTYQGLNGSGAPYWSGVDTYFGQTWVLTCEPLLGLVFSSPDGCIYELPAGSAGSTCEPFSYQGTEFAVTCSEGCYAGCPEGQVFVGIDFIVTG